MIRLQLHCNPITLRARTIVGGSVEPRLSDPFSESRGRIQGWVADYLTEVADVLNEPSYHLEFYGTVADYEDVRAEASRLQDSGDLDSAVVITSGTLIHPDFTAISLRLRELLGDVRHHPRFAQRAVFVESIERALAGNEFKVAVLATMSSGKSTIVNAMLGRSLLPSRNQATTAMITRIYDEDGRSDVEVRAFDAEGRELSVHRHADRVTMERLNQDANATSSPPGAPPTHRVRECHVKADVVGVNNIPAGHLVLIDTPGPNYAGNAEHAHLTHSLVQQDDQARVATEAADVVLYVLNATQLQTNDDDALLRQVAKFIEQGGLASRDRFVFVVNKVDQLDEEDDGPLSETMAKVATYLRGFGIQQPIVVPTMARAALYARIVDAGGELGGRKKADYAIEGGRALEARLIDDAWCWDGAKAVPRSLATSPDASREARVVAASGVGLLENCICFYLEKYWLPLKLQVAARELDERLLSERSRIELAAGVTESATDLAALDRDLARLRQLAALEGLGDAMRGLFESERHRIERRESPALRLFGRELIALLGKWKAAEFDSEAAWKREAARLEERAAGLLGRATAEIETELDELRSSLEQQFQKEFGARLRSLLENQDFETVPAPMREQVLLALDLKGIASRARRTETRPETRKVEKERHRLSLFRLFGSKTYTTEETIQVSYRVFDAEEAVKLAKAEWTKQLEGYRRTWIELRNRYLDDVERWVGQVVLDVSSTLSRVATELEATAHSREARATEHARLLREKAEFDALRARLDDILSLPGVEA